MPKPQHLLWAMAEVFVLRGLVLAFVGFVGTATSAAGEGSGNRGGSSEQW